MYISFVLLFIIKNRSNRLENFGFSRIFVVTFRAVNRMTTTWATATALYSIFFSKLVSTKTAFHASIPVSSKNLFKR